MWSTGWVKPMMKMKYEICQIQCHLIIWCNHIVVECFEELMLLDKLHSLPWDLGIIWVSLCTYIGVLGMLPLATRAFHSKRQAFIVVSWSFLLFLFLVNLYGPVVHMCLIVSPTLFFTAFASVVIIKYW